MPDAESNDDLQAMVEGYTRKPGLNRTFRLNQNDVKLVEWGAEFLGCSNSELVRNAIRAFVLGLQQMESRKR